MFCVGHFGLPGHFDFPSSVYDLWCFQSLSELPVPPLVHPNLYSKANDVIENALSRNMTNDRKLHLIYSVERIRL